jgi:hypothetical protein
VKTERGVNQGCYWSSILLNLYSEYLTKELSKVWRLKIEGSVICTVKYARNIVLLAKEEMVLQGMTDRKTEIEKSYGMEMNVVKLS